MSFEIEIKYRVPDHEALARRLEKTGAHADEPRDQVDRFYTSLSRDFAQTGEAVRIRSEGADNYVTYKGPRWQGPTKTRQEIELAFAPGEEAREKMGAFLEALGFKALAQVQKRRRTFHASSKGRPIEVVLDTVEGIGLFAEVEIVAANQADVPAAQAAVQELATALGLTEVEQRSYLRMVLEKGGGFLAPGSAAT